MARLSVDGVIARRRGREVLRGVSLAALALAALGFAVAWGLDHVQGYHAIQMTVLVPVLRANPLAILVSRRAPRA